MPLLNRTTLTRHFIMAVVITIIMALSLLIGFIMIFSQVPLPNLPEVENGSADLRSFPMDDTGTARLNGEWEFYWKRLLVPGDFTEGQPGDRRTIAVPGNWQNATPGDGIEVTGYGTYRLVITTAEYDGILGLRIPSILSAYRLWINGEPVSELGTVATDKQGTVARDIPRAVYFNQESDTIELVLQVSNFHDNFGGIWGDFLLGAEASIGKVERFKTGTDLLLFGAMMIFALYHIWLFLLHMKQPSTLFFGMLCFMVALRVILTGEHFLVSVFPSIPWVFQTKVEYAGMFAGILFLSLFFRYEYPVEYTKNVTVPIAAAGILLSTAVIVLPARAFTYMLLPGQVYMGVVILIMITLNVVAIVRGRKGALLILCGFIMGGAGVLNDILHANYIIKTAFLTPIGMLMLIVTQAVLLSYRYADLLRNQERMTDELQDYSTSLEARVRERTMQLQSANEMKSTFFINLAHETKTPLTLIANYMDKIAERFPGDRDVSVVLSNIGKLKQDMVNFLDLEKLEQGHILYDHSAGTDASRSAERQLLLFKELAARKKITIEQEVGESILVHLDPTAFERVINNLLDNAIKYTPVGGSISVTLECADGLCVCTVRDTGFGMTPEQLESIFLPFYQINHEKKNIQGIGMGLNIVKQIIDDAGGTIDVSSSPGEGAEFIVGIPLFDGDDLVPATGSDKVEKPVTVPLADEQATLNETRSRDDAFILIVEDNEDMRTYLVEALSEWYETASAVNGEDALSLLEKSRYPDLILSDVMMDRMDGFEFRRKLVERGGFEDVPFLFLTAKSAPDSRMTGLEIGAQDFITKPFSLKELQAKIRSILTTREAGVKRSKSDITSKMMRFIDEETGESERRKKADQQSIFDGFDLSTREREITELIRQGLLNKEIGARLGISESTVKKHMQNLFRKTGAQNRIELINKISVDQ
jgi:two-component system sensor histidine kinase ChiS